MIGADRIAAIAQLMSDPASFLSRRVNEEVQALQPVVAQGGITEQVSERMARLDDIAGVVLAAKQLSPTAAIGRSGADPRIPDSIPGTNMAAAMYVASPSDMTGQDWASPAHVQAHYHLLKNLLDAGLPAEHAFVLAGDDAMGGAGSLSGIEAPDGTDGFTPDEAAVFRLGALLQNRTGIPVIQMMMAGNIGLFAHNGARVEPAINQLLNAQLQTNLAADDWGASPERAAALTVALLQGLDGIEIGELEQHQAVNDLLIASMQGDLEPLRGTLLQVIDAASMVGTAPAAPVAGQAAAQQGSTMIIGPLQG